MKLAAVVTDVCKSVESIYKSQAYQLLFIGQISQRCMQTKHCKASQVGSFKLQDTFRVGFCRSGTYVEKVGFFGMRGSCIYSIGHPSIREQKTDVGFFGKGSVF